MWSSLNNKNSLQCQNKPVLKAVDKLQYSKTVDWVFQHASEPDMTGVSRQYTNPQSGDSSAIIPLFTEARGAPVAHENQKIS